MLIQKATIEGVEIKNVLFLNKIICLDTGGRSNPYTADLLGNLDFITQMK